MGFVFLTQQSLSFLLLFIYRSICSQMLFKIGVLKNFTNFAGQHLCWSLILLKLQTWFAATLLKRDSNTGVFPWNFFERLFLQSTSSSCFCVYLVDSRFVNWTDMLRLLHSYFPVKFVKFLKMLLTTSGGCLFLSQDAKHQNTLWQLHAKGSWFVNYMTSIVSEATGYYLLQRRI